MDLSKYKKISIVGPPGSGKSTLAKRLGEFYSLPVHHIDCYFWQQNWTMPDKKVFYEQIEKISKGKKWILEGNHKGTLENRSKKSDLIILLDFDVKFCENSVLERHNQKERVGLPGFLIPNNEKLDEILLSIQRWPTRRDEQFLPILTKSKAKFITLTNRKQVDEFVESLHR